MKLHEGGSILKNESSQQSIPKKQRINKPLDDNNQTVPVHWTHDSVTK